MSSSELDSSPLRSSPRKFNADGASARRKSNEPRQNSNSSRNSRSSRRSSRRSPPRPRAPGRSAD